MLTGIDGKAALSALQLSGPQSREVMLSCKRFIYVLQLKMTFKARIEHFLFKKVTTFSL